MSTTNFLSHMIHRRILLFALCSKLQSPERTREESGPPTQEYALASKSRTKILIGRRQQSPWSLRRSLRRELCLCSTCPVSNLTRIARKTNPLRNMVWLNLMNRFEIRHPIHHVASSVDCECIFEVEESFTQEYARMADTHRLGKTRLILLAAPRRAPGRPAMHENVSGRHATEIRIWTSLTIASTSFDKRSSYVSVVLRFPTSHDRSFTPEAFVVWHELDCIY